MRATNEAASFHPTSSSQKSSSTTRSGTSKLLVTIYQDLTNHIVAVPTPAAASLYSNRKAKLDAIEKIAQISQQSTESFTREDVDMLANDSDDESVRAPGRRRIVKATVEENDMSP